MAKVKNWQLNREMEYPYEEKKPKKQITYVFDTNKCIACQTCTVACKTTWAAGKGEETIFFNNVETKPYGGYPQKWDVNTLKELNEQEWGKGGVYKGKTIFESESGERVTGWRPEERSYAFPNIGEDEVLGNMEKGAFFNGIHDIWMFYLARICNHCSYPGCLAACPRKAIYKREEDGIVLIDQSRCRGYKECVKACPYKKTFFNMVTRVSEKCIGCYPLIEQGEQPRCVTSCIGKIRLQGFMEDAKEPRRDSPFDMIVRIKKIALPLYPQFGTQPNVYYVPPVHVPKDFLIQMFGPNVEDAITLYRNMKDDKELLAAFMLFGNTPRIIHSYKAEENHAVGYNEIGDEIVRVPYVEPVHNRPHWDAQFQTFRHNTP
ncbi:MAG: dehydrogenase [Bacteroidetes bacterium]|nr:dehydrogenase [Bacteroidota bacterium]